jgi:lipopolysaccharide transport system permease protein
MDANCRLRIGVQDRDKMKLNDNSARFLVSHRKILWGVTRNELKVRYAGSLLGITWMLLGPMLILGVYSVVYLYIFRVQPDRMTSEQYTLYIFAGLAPYLMTAEALSFGVSSVIANKLVLSNTVFPIDLAPIKAVLISQGSTIVGFAIILFAGVWLRLLSWTILLLPIVWILHLMFLAGLNWILSLINIVFRDLQYLITIVLMILVIASPIAYTPDMIPRSLKLMIILNPMAYYFSAYQKILVLGQIPNVFDSLVLIILSIGSFWLGGWLFARLKRVLIDYV